MGVRFQVQVILEPLRGRVATGGVAGANAGSIVSSWNTGTVMGSSATTNPSQVGGLVGSNSGTITGTVVGGVVFPSFSSGNVSGNDNVGGLIGANGGTVSGLNNYVYTTSPVSVQGNSPEGIGEIAGLNNGTLSDFAVSSSFQVNGNTLSTPPLSVSTATFVGAIVGVNQGTGIISNVSNNISVTWRSPDTGGLIGINEPNGSVNTSSAGVSSNSGTVIGGTVVSGVIGANESGNLLGTIYDTGNVTGSADVGGFIGLNTGNLNFTNADMSTNNFYGNGTLIASGSSTSCTTGTLL